MKSKTLVILLIIPFIIGLLTFVSLMVFNIAYASDISIDLSSYYNVGGENGFKIQPDGYLLKADVDVKPDSILADGNYLVWSLEDNEDEVASIKIVNEDDTTNDPFLNTRQYYLVAQKEGRCSVVCSNARGTVSSRFDAVIYENGAIIINPSTYKASGSQIENTRYYGEYDIIYDDLKKDDYTKIPSFIDLDATVVGDIDHSALKVKSHSDNIKVDNASFKVDFISSGEAEVVFSCGYIESSYKFNIVKDGINIYSYNDLLMATNYSSNPRPIVMQVSLGSLYDVYECEVEYIGGDIGMQQGAINYKPILPLIKKNKGFELFGNYDEVNNTYKFKDEVYRYESTYNTEFIDDYNEGVDESKKVSKELVAGIHLSSDLYGNGFSINMNGLAYPRWGHISEAYRRLYPSVNDDTSSYAFDLFKGPLAFVTIGSPKADESSVVKAYGEDNAGIYIDTPGVTINDINIKNIDDNSNKRNYAYIGSVINVNANDVIIKNSILSNGKNIIRATDADNLLISNCILKNSAEFNLKVGSNKYEKYDETKNITTTIGGNTISKSFKEFYDNKELDANANSVLETYLAFSDTKLPYLDEKELYDSLSILQNGLDNTSNIVNSDGSVNYAANMEVKDTLFDESGIFSIAFETMFNGPFLYSGLSSSVETIASLLGGLPSKVGGTSYPVNLTLSGKTNFYDWKKFDDIDISTLIEEALSTLAASLAGTTVEIGIDDFFPMKQILRKYARSNGFIYTDENGAEYINSKIAYYGGGLNLSNLNYNLDEAYSKDFSDNIDVDLIFDSNEFVNSNQIMQLLSKCVLFAAGFNPFKFITNDKVNEKPIYFDESPKIDDLRKNLIA